MFTELELFLDACTSQRRGCALVSPWMSGLSSPGLQAEFAARGIRLPMLTLTGDGPMPGLSVNDGHTDYLPDPAEENTLVERVRQAVYLHSMQCHVRSGRLEVNPRFERLSRRQREVLALVVQGRTSRQIAAILGIGKRTVDAHRSNIMRKVGASSLADLIRLSIESDVRYDD